jgi:hypothetical protein
MMRCLGSVCNLISPVMSKLGMAHMLVVEVNGHESIPCTLYGIVYKAWLCHFRLLLAHIHLDRHTTLFSFQCGTP